MATHLLPRVRGVVVGTMVAVAPNRHRTGRSTVHVRIPQELRDLVDAKREVEGRELTDVVIELLRRYVSDPPGR